jgi:acyl carrier protein
MTPSAIRSRLSSLVLGVHRRNGGTLPHLDFAARLLDPTLLLDSLDLAEVMAAIQKDFGVSPFEGSPPRTWNDVATTIENSCGRKPAAP